MKYRKLRFAWSVAWGLLGLLVVVLWWRSYSRLEEVMFRQLCLASFDGHVAYRWDSPGPTRAFEFWSYEYDPTQSGAKRQILGFRIVRSSDGLVVMSPTWFVLLLLSVLTVGPWTRWFRWHFSLRTLLITMTLVAVGLGWIVYATRN
jgi:hypothetical protein